MTTWTKIASKACGTLLTGCVTGANHLDKNLPCQDASLASLHYYKGYPYALLAVADGHGSARYTRSELGAHFAMQAVTEAAARWIMFAVACLEQQPDDWLVNVRNEFSSRFAKTLKQAWERNVDEHLAAFPLNDDTESESTGYSAYGTTVALALVFNEQVFIGAIGDSTVLIVQALDGVESAEDSLFGDKADTLGLVTHSLASSDAVLKWKHRVLPLSELRLLCAVTDGFTDSLTDAARTLAGIYRDAINKGDDWLQDKLPEFLQRLTQQGVGDDIATVLYFPPASNQPTVIQDTGDTND